MAEDDAHSDKQGDGDTRRHTASLRMRKYRSQKKVEFQQLEAEWKFLEQTLHELQRESTMQQARRAHAPGGRPVLARDDHQHRLAEQLAHHTSQLRGDVEAQYRLACCLRDWVASQVPAPGLTPHASWMHSTLCADPAARRLGLQWLSDRLYHTSHSVIPHHPMEGRGGDACQLTAHTNDNDDLPLTIVAMEFHFQFDIVFVPFETVMHVMESMGGRSTFVIPDIVALQVVESVGDNLKYLYGANPNSRVTLRRISNVYRNADGTQAVMTSAKVAEDERYPLQPGELRSHGFGWTVAHKVADNITRVRGSVLHYTPFSTDGVIPLDRIGALFGVESAPHRRREAIIAQVQAQAEAMYADNFWRQIHGLRQYFMQTVPSS